MELFYFPKKLELAREQIVQIHSTVAEAKEAEVDSGSFKELLMKIVSLEEYAVEGFSYTISRKELLLLGIYLPRNQYEVNLRNVYLIFRYHLNESVMRAIFEQWQKYYTKRENARIFAMIANQPVMRQKLEEMAELTPMSIEACIPSGRVVELFSSTATAGNYGAQCDTIENYEEMLERVGLKLEYALGKACKKEFYLVCSGKAYMKMGEGRLLNEIMPLGKESKKRFLLNLLRRLENQELNRFFRIADYYFNLTGSYGMDSFRQYFAQVPQDLVNKYIAWINRLNINRVFMQDASSDRIRFWMKYADDRNVRVSYMKPHNCLIFEFKRSMFIEFAEIGPVYEYDTTYYERCVHRELIRETKTTELKSWLRNVSNYEMLKEHRGYWQNEVARKIERAKR